ncbi:MAG: DUF1592 domain-containing protein [Isosphaeraceae bacterium]
MTTPSCSLRWTLAATGVASLCVGLVLARGEVRVAQAAEPKPADAVARFRETVEPVLEDHCYACHGNGVKKGGISLDGPDPLNGRRDLWYSALKNVRAGLMPPADKPRLAPDEVKALETWVKRDALGLDPAHPDPGRVTLRRLNRIEYRNTIRDLMGIDYNTEEEFPPDDTGYGFDTIGDVLSVSPLLLEKYMQAAETIVAQAVPTVSRVVPTETVTGSMMRGPAPDGRGRAGGERISFYDAMKVERQVRTDKPGKRRLVITLNVDGAFEFDPGRCRVVFQVDGREVLREEYAWQDGKTYSYEREVDWEPGEHTLTFTTEPLTPREKKASSIFLRIVSVKVEGPLDPSQWERPKNFDRFFSADDPKTREGRDRYARETLRRFAGKAFRRPVDEPTLDRLVALAAETYAQPGKSVEDGLTRAFVAVLSSPRFVFRVEQSEPGTGPFPLIDEYALAARLSYFLWSTMPDETLTKLAAEGALRKNLREQLDRMVRDRRSDMLVRNFTGQWLQSRDIENIAIDSRTVLARDDGQEKELKREQEEFKEFLVEREKEAQKAKAEGRTAPRFGGFGSARQSGRFRRLFTPPRVELDSQVRQAMKRETEMVFGEVVRENRSVLDLIDADYTYLNAKLAKFYDIPGVVGDYMHRVTLPKDSPRGGVLTQGTVLVVTSNPTRTSPVKRGLFILDNILGTPAPPAPPDVPQLEEAEKGFKDREPTLREVLEIHRAKPLCNACHSRMDPLGLAFENFNAMGLYRKTERGQALDTGGTLLTGESFDSVKALKRVILERHRGDFYRCLTEKLLTYAIGRGVEATDVEAVDRIVARLESEEGKFSALLAGVIDSAPFQRRREVSAAKPTAANPPVERPTVSTPSSGGTP